MRPSLRSTDLSRASAGEDRKSTRLNSSHTVISYAVFCLKKKKKKTKRKMQTQKKTKRNKETRKKLMDQRQTNHDVTQRKIVNKYSNNIHNADTHHTHAVA